MADNTLWTRVANPAGDNADGSIDFTLGRVNATLSTVTGAYVLASYICGDDVCDTGFGENNKAHLTLGYAYEMEGRFDEAEKEYLAALAIYRSPEAASNLEMVRIKKAMSKQRP